MGRFDFENMSITLAKNLLTEEGWLLHYADMIAAQRWIGTPDIFVNEGYKGEEK